MSRWRGVAGLGVLLAILAVRSGTAHQDTIFPIAPNGLLQRFPDQYGPASLKLDPASGVPATALIRIGSHEIDLPLCIRKLFALPPSQEIEALGSWYHDFSTLPPYLIINLPQRRVPDQHFEGYALMFDMAKGTLIEVRNWRETASHAWSGALLELSAMCTASEREQLVPRTSNATVPPGAFDSGHGKTVADCLLVGSAQGELQCLTASLAATDESYAKEVGWIDSCEEETQPQEELSELRRFREHFCGEHLPKVGDRQAQKIEKLRCELEIMEASLHQVAEFAYKVCIERDASK